MEKIDFVVTWVDGNDPAWQAEKAKYSPDLTDSLDDTWNDNVIRYRDWDVLKYWFRSVEKNAPWVNKIHFITWGHLPDWLNTNHPKLNIVKHSDYIPSEYLPTFNSNAIEMNMHRIEGLAERFVYFNDDVYLIRPTKETDFFKNGLPCETATLETVALELDVGHSEIRNMQVINKYFCKKEVLKKNWRKWFNPVYGKHLLKTFLLLPWERFTGMYEGHITSAYIKNTFETVWNNEPLLCHNTCTSKFRNDNNLNHWIVKNWQLAEGNFIPRSPKIGKMYFQKIDKTIVDDIVKKKHKILCINDFACSQQEFEEQKQLLNNAFEKIFPQKSGFEK